MSGRLLLIGVAACLASTLVTWGALAFVRSRNLLDLPNERSSHSSPTPRGGGVAIVLTFLLGILLLYFRQEVTPNLFYALSGGGLLVAAIGWIDDVRGLSVRVRILVHFFCAGWAVWWLGGLERIWPLETMDLGVVGSLLALIGIVWSINLYNFMDGIDGIAASEAVTVAGSAAVLLLLRGDRQIASAAVLLAGTGLGFLFWNWPPARIFMGDVGSGFLGFVFAVLALASEKAATLPLLFWLVLSGVFVFDATATLLRRLMNGEAFWNAHRSHAYQRMTLIASGHAAVTRIVVAINLLLATVAFVSVRDKAYSLAALVFAVLLLSFAYRWVERRSPMRFEETRGGG